MKLLEITALLGGLLAVAVPVLASSAYSWEFTLDDGGGSPYSYDVTTTDGFAHDPLLLLDLSSKHPQFRESIDETYVTNLVNDLANKSDVGHTHPASAINGFNFAVDSRLTSSTSPRRVYYNNTAQATSTEVMFSTTTSSGTAVMYLTTDGTPTGPALCPNTIQHVNVFVDDASNTYGLSKTMSNSNKTLTVTANVRSFSSTTILGISVLGSSSLGAAANGTQIMAKVDCN